MRNTRNLIAFTLLIFIISNNCFSQNDWKAGYIIKNEGDTLYGFIDNRVSRSNSKQCYFRENENDKSQIFSANELFGYRFIDSKFYISKTIEGLESANPVFLEFLIQGELNVYHYISNESRFFVEDKGEIHELKNTKVIKQINSAEYEIENREYIRLLTYLLQEANMQNEIRNSRLTSKNLIKIAKNYHETICTDRECIIYERSKPKVNVDFGIHVGMTMNKINFGNMTVSNYSSGTLLGCRLEFESLFEWIENLNLVIDYNYNRYTVKKLIEIQEDTYTYITYNNKDYRLRGRKYSTASNMKSLDVDLKVNVLQIPVTLNYYFSKGKIRPYIGAGVTTIYVLSQNEDFIYHLFYDEYGKSIPTFHLGFTGKVGSNFMFNNGKGIYVNLSYEYTKSLNVNQFLRFTNSIFALNCGFLF